MSSGAIRRQTLDTAECLDFLNEVEDRLPVNQWSIDGIGVWPMVRERIWWFHADLTGPARQQAGTEALRARRLRQMVEFPRALGRYAVASISDVSHTVSTRRRADVVFLGDNLSRIWLDDSWFDRLCEPMIGACHELGLTTLHLEPHNIYRTPRHNRSRWIQPRIDARWIRSRAPLPAAFTDGELAEFELLAAMLRDRHLDPSPVEPSQIRRQARLVRLVASYFGSILDRVRPRLVALVDYYAVASMGLLVACRDRGIPSMDLQHGVQGELHWAYSRWGAVPFDGYQLIPDLFWVWSDDEADTIRGWAEGATTRHRPVVGGNPWLDLWLRGEDALVRHYDGLVDSLATPAGPNVLVTLQPGFASPPELGLLVEAARESPRSSRWWFRIHPLMQAGEIRYVEEAVASVPSALVSRPEDCPLYALLRRADIHVTRHSSTVLEAHAFAVPSVTTSPDGLAFFPQQSASGWLVCAETPTALRKAVAELAATPPVTAPPPRPRPATETLRAVMEGLR